MTLQEFAFPVRLGRATRSVKGSAGKAPFSNSILLFWTWPGSQGAAAAYAARENPCSRRPAMGVGGRRCRVAHSSWAAGSRPEWHWQLWNRFSNQGAATSPTRAWTLSGFQCSSIAGGVSGQSL